LERIFFAVDLFRKGHMQSEKAAVSHLSDL